MNPPDWIADLGLRVADAKQPVDWDAAVARAASAEEAAMVDRLRTLERVAAAHFAAARGTAVEQCPGALDESTPHRWGGLEIIRRLGGGAYGEVYLARDPRLDRLVALKLIPTEAPSGTTDVIHEARLLAKLRHPNVVAVYGADVSDGRVGIWMELVDGPTLEELFAGQALDEHSALEIGVQLCAALDAVHGAGVIHRDIKAQNVVREEDGRIVLMDFGTGIAALERGSGGAVTGTPLYMAPELFVRGDATAQSDIYSVGVLLFRLLTGRFPVEGRTPAELAETHAAARRVSVSDSCAGVSPATAATIERALAARPDERFRCARDMHGALAGALAALGGAAADPSSRTWRLTTTSATLVVAAALLAGVSFAAGLGRSGRGITTASRSTSALRQLTFNSFEMPVIAQSISPDGKYLAYADPTGLALEAIGTGDARRLPFDRAGTLTDVGWLPDSTTLIVATTNGIWRMSIFGDAPRKITDGGGLIAVSPDGMRIAVTSDSEIDSTIRIISAHGEPEAEIVHAQPPVQVSRATWGPGGRRLAFTKWGGDTPLSILTSRPDGTAQTLVFTGAVKSLIWAPDGRLIFSRPNAAPKARTATLWQLRVDGSTGVAMTAPTLITDAPDMTFIRPTLTADGRTLAFTVARPRLDVYSGRFEPARIEVHDLHRAVFQTSENIIGGWTPAGNALLFVSLQNGGDQLYRQPLGLADAQPLVVERGSWVRQAVFSGDSRWIYYLAGRKSMLERTPAGGGPAEDVFAIDGRPERAWLECAPPPSTACVVSTDENGRIRFLGFDATRPRRGVPREVPAPPSPQTWDLSPDGRRVATVTTSGSIIVLDVTTGAKWQRESNALAGAESVGWAGDGWLVTRTRGHGGEILYVDRATEPRVVWHSPYQRLWSPKVSPDRRLVAFSSWMSESCVWMLQHF